MNKLAWLTCSTTLFFSLKLVYVFKGRRQDICDALFQSACQYANKVKFFCLPKFIIVSKISKTMCPTTTKWPQNHCEHLQLRASPRLLRYRAVWETLPFPDTVSTLHSVSQPTHCSQSVAGKLCLQAEMSVEDPGGRVCMSSRHSKKWPQAQSQTDRRRWSAKSVPVDQNKKIALPVGQQSFCFGLLHIWSFFSFKHQTVEFLFTDFNNWCQ